MLHRFLLISFLTICTVQLNASDNVKIARLKNISSSCTLPIVYGWYHNEKSNKWVTKEKEIPNIDKFIDYHILSFYSNGEKYIAIVKEQKDGNDCIFDTYVIDYNNYADQISLWEEHTLLKYPILKHHRSRIKKNEPLTNSLLGINDLSDLLVNPRDSFVFQYKFSQDSTVKFLFYVEKCSLESCKVGGLNTNEKYRYLYKYIGKDELYNNFFLKTTSQYFTKFTDSPLNK